MPLGGLFRGFCGELRLDHATCHWVDSLGGIFYLLCGIACVLTTDCQKRTNIEEAHVRRHGLV